MSPENRKAQSERILTALGVSFNAGLPLIESEAETKLRTPAEVARRVTVLTGLCAPAAGYDRHEVLEYLESNKLLPYASPAERQFFDNPAPTEQQSINASWCAEAIWLLLWALGLVDKLEPPIEQCSIADLVSLVPGPGESTAEFIAESGLRTVAEILDASDFVYRAHWVVRNAEFDPGTSCGDLNAGVVQERHHAVNWLTCYDDQLWDEVSTDT